MARKKMTSETKEAIGTAIRKARMEVVDIDSVDLWDAGKDNKNPRKNEKAVDKLAKVLHHYGQITPITVYTGDNMIRKGNTTKKAMKKNGAKEIRVLFVDFPSVMVANAYGMVDNKSGEWSDWDDEILARYMTQREFALLDKEEVGMLTGLSDREQTYLKYLKNYSRTDSGLPDVDLKGVICGTNESIIIIFERKADYQRFKNKLDLSEKTRTIKYSQLKEHIEWIQ